MTTTAAMTAELVLMTPSPVPIVVKLANFNCTTSQPTNLSIIDLWRKPQVASYLGGHPSFDLAPRPPLPRPPPPRLPLD